MTIRVISTEEEFQGLESLWQELHASNPNHTPYQSWHWNFTWWKHFGSAGELQVLLVEDAGAVLGIAPFRLRRRFHGFPIPHLELISGKDADYLDLLVRPNYEAPCLRELFEFLASRPQWRFIELREMRDDSTNLPHIHREVFTALPILAVRTGDVCVSVPLSATWEDYLGTVSKRTRKDIGYDRRSFEKNFAAELKTFTTWPEAATGLEALIAVYRSRWLDEKGATQFDSEAGSAFEREICERFTRAGWYRLYVLYADQKPVAALSGVEVNGRYFAQLFVHSPEFHKYSVGSVLMGMALGDCIERGCALLDLTRGAEPYKLRWNGQKKRNVHLRAFRTRGLLLQASFADWIYERGFSIKVLHRMRAQYQRWRHRGGSDSSDSTQ